MTAISIIYWHFKEKLSYTEYNYHNKNTTMYVFISRYIVELEVSSLVERIVTTKEEVIVLYFLNHWRKCWIFQWCFTNILCKTISIRLIWLSNNHFANHHTLLFFPSLVKSACKRTCKNYVKHMYIQVYASTAWKIRVSRKREKQGQATRKAYDKCFFSWVYQ